ncbi:MAG: class I SAM-dependent methyltransferase [Desulfobacteraceae bacterium]|nr:MAG: class I SAM-dependent methyltransferase [Desulfobacteraceae bacterium]
MESGQGNAKRQLQAFWNEASCGEVYAVGETEAQRLDRQEAERYRLEPYISSFARFHEGKGIAVLEVGIGMGADHLQWARECPARLVGIDLTPRAVAITSRRLDMHGFPKLVFLGDAENLPFLDHSFDLVYSYGVLHHSPDTRKATHEVRRVLRPGGKARIMIYHRNSPVGWLLWIRYAGFSGQWRTPLSEIYSRHLESPGTKAFTKKEAKELFPDFSIVNLRVRLSFGDLLQGEVGQRHRGFALSVAKRLWPSWILKRLDGWIGLCLFVEAQK